MRSETLHIKIQSNFQFQHEAVVKNKTAQEYRFVYIKSKEMLLFGGWITRNSAHDTRNWYRLSLIASEDDDN